jgi:hypothetical protein
MKEQHGVVGELPESDCLLFWRKFAIHFVQPHAYTIPNVPIVNQSVHTGVVRQFANGLDEKEANLK